MKRLRILIIGIGDPVPTFIGRRIEAIVKSGLEVIVVAEAKQSVPDFSGAQVLRIGGNTFFRDLFFALGLVLLFPRKFFRLMSHRRELGYRKRFRWALKYFPLSELEQPDLVHLQWIASASEYKWLRHYFHCPIIGSARGSQVTVYPLTREGYAQMVKEALQAVDYVHCVSKDMADACLKLGADATKLVVNYNGIDLSRFHPNASPGNSTAFTLISVGSLMWRKAYGYQLQVLKMLKQEGRSVRVLIIGDGNELEGLKYMAHVLGVTDGVTFVGQVPANELPQLYQSADLYISTSVAEGLSNSVVEAAACGLPIISFDCEGMKEVVHQSQNGFILPVGNVSAMAEKVAWFMDHPEKRIEMGAASRKIATEEFDERFWLNEMIKIYETLGKR